MRKLVLFTGTAIVGISAPASACDYHLLGGPQRFNAFAATTDDALLPRDTASEDRRALPQREPLGASSTVAAEVLGAPALDNAGAAPGNALPL